MYVTNVWKSKEVKLHQGVELLSLEKHIFNLKSVTPVIITKVEYTPVMKVSTAWRTLSAFLAIPENKGYWKTSPNSTRTSVKKIVETCPQIASPKHQQSNSQMYNY